MGSGERAEQVGDDGGVTAMKVEYTETVSINGRTITKSAVIDVDHSDIESVVILLRKAVAKELAMQQYFEARDTIDPPST